MTAKQNLLAISLLMTASLVSSRLVVYGPKGLKDKFEDNGKINLMNTLKY